MTKKTNPMPVLYGEAVLALKPELPHSRAEMLAKIESGELEFLDVPATVFRTGRNSNFVVFNDDELPAFASSFKGVPFLENHEQRDIGARLGTVDAASMEGDPSTGSGQAFVQTLRITTRDGMTKYVEGQIDRFSIGWYYKDILCTVCNLSWSGCPHFPGREYDTPNGKMTCELLFTRPRGKETSAVNAPAVEGTGLLEVLEAYKNALAEHQDDSKIISGASPALIGGAKASSKPKTTKGGRMSKKLTQGEVLAENEDGEELTPLEQQLEANRIASESLLGAQQRQDALNAQLEKGNALLVAQCQNLLTTGLQNSRLPKVTQDRIERSFKGRVFEPSELAEAIDEARKEIEQLTAPGLIQGPGRLSQMFNSNDQVQAALDDLLGAPREEGMESLKVHKMRSIRQAYLDMTGDFDFVGGFFGEQAQLASSFPGIVVNAMNKILVKAWAKYGEAGYNWWEEIVTVEHSDNVQDIDWIITGTIGSLPTVAKNGEYTELPIGDNKERTSWTKYGGYVGISLEDLINDNIRAFKKMPDEVALGALRNISEVVAALFTQNSAAGPTMADGGALFNSTAVTTEGGHKNLLTTALGTDFTAWEAAAAAIYDQPMHVADEAPHFGTGKKQALDPKFILVPRALRGQANNLFVQRQPSVTTNSDWYGAVKVKTVPEWTDANDWASVVDPLLLNGIMLGEIFGVKPQIFVAGGEQSPAMFSNDESRIKVRQFLNVGVANWRALHKNNVT
jgi:hypothetical protein